ncbi:MAG: zinc-binding dehydrogenase [Actinomycetota bacterium]|nr:zinc-binding dehydrogenase [Actinomycetota bacterium]
MLALQYRASLPRYAAARIRPRTGVGALTLVTTRPPELPGEDWVSVRPRLSGICGSDQAVLDASASPALASLTSGPFVPGHEVVGDVAMGPARGQRVVVEPALGCVVRGLDPRCPECAQGRHALCRAVIDGDLSAGLQTGFCRETGGGWSEGLVAHASQLHSVPDALTDEDAVLAEPLACALHAVREAELGDAETVAVVGAGTIGLLTVAALREVHPGVIVLAVAKHRGQDLEARRLGADATCRPGRLQLEGVRMTGARRLVGHLGRELLLGGFDAVFDCVGSGESLEAAVASVRPRGRVMLVGMPGRITADLALAWQREVRLHGAYGYRDDFPDALELAGRLGLGRLVANGWPLSDYRRALADAPRSSRLGRVKTVFDLRAAA